MKASDFNELDLGVQTFSYFIWSTDQRGNITGNIDGLTGDLGYIFAFWRYLKVSSAVGENLHMEIYCSGQEFYKEEYTVC